MKLALIAVLIGTFNVTSYRSVPSQTDDSPYITSIGERVHPHGIALSRDLLKRWGGSLDYGDWIYIEDIGFKVVNDCMADFMCLDSPQPVNKENCQKRKDIRKSVDVWVSTKNKEKAFYSKFKNKKLNVWKVRGEIQYEKTSSKHP